ncbi:hypothetical protein PR048_007897 [Dryococelus australis]|uniref:Uncharacterized protein n=1 Tax=Dryococelus australis TaxID=614101 RepID=A0ABQ9HVJ2_9NEOP|nr:hypothetical protein PR048_007897 [Dryococelus australis]
MRHDFPGRPSIVILASTHPLFGSRTPFQSCNHRNSSPQQDSILEQLVEGWGVRMCVCGRVHVAGAGEGRPLTVKRVSMEQRRNERAGEMGDPRENPLTSGIVRHDSHMRKPGSDPTGNRTRFAFTSCVPFRENIVTRGRIGVSSQSREFGGGTFIIFSLRLSLSLFLSVFSFSPRVDAAFSGGVCRRDAPPLEAPEYCTWRSQRPINLTRFGVASVPCCDFVLLFPSPNFISLLFPSSTPNPLPLFDDDGWRLFLRQTYPSANALSGRRVHQLLCGYDKLPAPSDTFEKPEPKTAEQSLSRAEECQPPNRTSRCGYHFKIHCARNFDFVCMKQRNSLKVELWHDFSEKLEVIVNGLYVGYLDFQTKTRRGNIQGSGSISLRACGDDTLVTPELRQDERGWTRMYGSAGFSLRIWPTVALIWASLRPLRTRFLSPADDWEAEARKPCDWLTGSNPVLRLAGELSIVLGPRGPFESSLSLSLPPTFNCTRRKARTLVLQLDATEEFKLQVRIWAALNIEVLRADEGEVSIEQHQKWKGRGEREIPEKTSRPAASSGTIPTCENPGVGVGRKVTGVWSVAGAVHTLSFRSPRRPSCPQCWMSVTLTLDLDPGALPTPSRLYVVFYFQHIGAVDFLIKLPAIDLYQLVTLAIPAKYLHLFKEVSPSTPLPECSEELFSTHPFRFHPFVIFYPSNPVVYSGWRGNISFKEAHTPPKTVEFFFGDQRLSSLPIYRQSSDCVQLVRVHAHTRAKCSIVYAAFRRLTLIVDFTKHTRWEMFLETKNNNCGNCMAV